MDPVEPSHHPRSTDYRAWLTALKARLRHVQIRAAVVLNEELLRFYWDLGADIVAREQDAVWGSGFLKQLSQDLRVEFPEMKGFYFSNIKCIRQWFRFFAGAPEKGQQLVGQLGGGREGPDLETARLPPYVLQIPWGHNLALISKCKSTDEALFYAQRVVEHGWSRSVLLHQIELGLWGREGQAQSNFSRALPEPQSDLAKQTLKDPYVFDFLNLTPEYNERELEVALTQQITKFLLELGSGFAFIGRQLPLRVGNSEFFLHHMAFLHDMANIPPALVTC